MNAPNPGETPERPPTGTARPRSGWERVKLIVQVIEIRLRFIVILVGTGLAIGYWDTIQNYWDKWTRPKTVAVHVEADTEFYCPMHPWVARTTRDPDGSVPECPICGMSLSTRKKGVKPELPANVTGRVQFSPDRIRLAGLKTEKVGYRTLVKEIVTVGSVRYDESQLSRIVTRVGGYVEKLFVNKTFERVELGQPMVELYSPELVSAVRELLEARKGNVQLNLESIARSRLEWLGVASQEIDAILRSGNEGHRLLIRSPQAGYVIKKDVLRGARVDPGMALFDVADVSKVWIEADVFEKDIAFLRVGQPVQATVESLSGRVFAGKVALVHPMVDVETRTNAVRFTVDNAQLWLRPGMYATVRISVPLAEADAFRSAGFSAPSAAATGPATGAVEYFTCSNHPEVGQQGPGECPTCKSKLQHRTLARNQRLIWWCPMHPEVTSDKSGGTCQICGGMKLEPKIVELAAGGQVLAVPEPAVIDTGTKRIVYVGRDSGVFEGVLVELGPRVGEFFPVIRGLQAGDSIVTRGAFLVDAETRLNPAAGAAYSGGSGGPKSAAAQAPVPDDQPRPGGSHH